jgi:hypothetical protein
MIAKIRLIFFILAIILLSFSMLFSNEKSLFELLNVNNLTIYTSDNVKDFETILSGNGFTFSCNVSEYKNLKCDINGVSFETNLSPEQIFNKVKIRILNKQVLTQENNIMEIYYCYLENVQKEIVCESKKINLQIVFNGEKTLLGIPLLLGSY